MNSLTHINTITSSGQGETISIEEVGFLSIDSIRSAFAFIDEAGIDLKDVIIVGGTVMELLGLRKSGDIDLILTPSSRRLMEINKPGSRRGPFEAINLDQVTQILKDPYRSIGILDNDLFDRGLFISCNVPGLGCIKVARPELEFGKKLFRNRAKDRNDNSLLVRFALESDGWDWQLVPVSPVKNATYGSGKRVLRNHIAKVYPKALPAIRHPLITSKKILGRLRQRIGPYRRRVLQPNELSIRQLDTGILLQLQFQKGLFRRYDTLVRAETMESYLSFQRGVSYTTLLPLLSADHEIFREYNRMQDLRVGRDSVIGFQELMVSIQRKGLHADRYPITLDSNGRLKDGSHRLCAALHHGIDSLPVRFVPGSKGPLDYGREWFEIHGFEEDYLKSLDKRLLNYLNNTGAAFQLIVWPPAMQFESEIYEMLAAQHSVIAEIRQINLKNFPKFVEAAYLSDDIEHWKIQKKIFHMQNCKPVISVFSFLMDEPRYRVKTRTQSYLSDSVAKLKAEIRNRYKNRIEGYVHDIITHIGDNPAMNRDIVKTLNSHGAEFTYGLLKPL